MSENIDIPDSPKAEWNQIYSIREKSSRKSHNNLIKNKINNRLAIHDHDKLEIYKEKKFTFISNDEKLHPYLKKNHRDGLIMKITFTAARNLRRYDRGLQFSSYMESTGNYSPQLLENNTKRRCYNHAK